MFNFLKKKFPRITTEMIEPVDAMLSTTAAKTVYKTFMLNIGYCDKKDITDNVRYFDEEIKLFESGLKAECTECKNNIRKYKKELLKLEQKSMKISDEDLLDDLNFQMDSTKEEICIWETDLIRISNALEKFKQDKRDFLIEYVNKEIHGK